MQITPFGAAPNGAARMAQHARRHLPAPTAGIQVGASIRDVTLAALGAAVAANSMPNIERYLMEAAELGVSPGELAAAVDLAHEVQQNAARIHTRLTAKLLGTPVAAAGPSAAESAAPAEDGGTGESCPCNDPSAGPGQAAAPASEGSQ